MLIKRVKNVAPLVDLSSYQYPKHGLLAGFEWNFHPEITILSKKKTSGADADVLVPGSGSLTVRFSGFGLWVSVRVLGNV